MKNNPLISIGLPVVKHNFLDKSINSCLSQIYTNIEIIIVNNAKNNSIKNKIRSIVLKNKDKRIKYYENKTQIPMIQNWNLTLNYAHGEFFTILCDDDTWEEDFIAELYNLSLKYPSTNIFHSRVNYINERDEIIKKSRLCPEFETGLDLIYNRILIKNYRELFLSDFLVKTKCLKKQNGFIDFPDGWGSDDITWFKIAINGGVAYSSKFLYNYRVNDLNVTNMLDISSKIYSINLQLEEIHKILNKDLLKKNDLEIKKIKKIKNLLRLFAFFKKMNLYKRNYIQRFKLPKFICIIIAVIKVILQKEKI